MLVALHMEFHEWWSRALQAGTHFVDVANDGQAVCDQVRGGGLEADQRLQ